MKIPPVAVSVSVMLLLGASSCLRKDFLTLLFLLVLFANLMGLCSPPFPLFKLVALGVIAIGDLIDFMIRLCFFILLVVIKAGDFCCCCCC